jgi:tetratricopeptide (TPR) repeat protein
MPVLLISLFLTLPPAVDEAGRLRGGGSHRAEIQLRKGDLLRGVVDQQGIDVVVRILDPAGAALLTIDSPNGATGPEPVLMVAAATGRHVLELRALHADAAEGAFAIRLEAPRPAAPREREEAEGLAAWAEAWEERAIGLAGAPGARAHYLKARAAGERSLRLRRRLHGGRHVEVADSLDVLGYIHDELGDYKAGLDAFVESLAIREEKDPSGGRTLETRSDLGWLRAMSGDPAGARREFEAVLAVEPTRQGSIQGLTRALFDLGDMERARETGRAIQGTNHLKGEIELALGRRDDAQATAAEVERRLPAPPAHVHVGQAYLLEVLAQVALARGDSAAAGRHLERARATREAALGPEHPAMVRNLTLDGRRRAADRDLPGALATLRRALALGERTLGPNHIGLAPALDALAAVESQRGDRCAAEAALVRSIAIREKVVLPSHPELERARAALAALRGPARNGPSD